MSIGDEPAFPVMKSNGQTSEGLTKRELCIIAFAVAVAIRSDLNDIGPQAIRRAVVANADWVLEYLEKGHF